MLKMQFTLPGVFAGNPFPLGVNGSLWSLRPELHAYVAVAVLGLAGVLASRRVASAVSVVLVVLHVGAPGVVASVIGEAGPLLAFLAGAMLLLWRDVVPWRWWILAILVAGWAVLPAGNLTAVWTAVTFAYGVLMLGYRTPGVGPRVLRGHDLSYGTYLYAFPVQQSVAALVPGISVAGMIAISLPVTLALGFASWHLIESPALRLKTRVVAGRERGAEALPAVA
jgi:peptidoglycan/LPS O-acetylase OafA/YrhL